MSKNITLLKDLSPKKHCTNELLVKSTIIEYKSKIIEY